jgi:hypothetical protein
MHFDGKKTRPCTPGEARFTSISVPWSPPVDSQPSPIRIAHDRNPAAFCDGVWGLAVTIRQAGVDQANAITMNPDGGAPISCPRPPWLKREPFTITVPTAPQFRSWDTIVPVGAVNY